jgi:GTP-binding protein
VDAAGTEGRDPIADVYAIWKELEIYNPDIAKRPQVIAANKIDVMEEEALENVDKMKQTFEPMGHLVLPISAVTGVGVRELLYEVHKLLQSVQEPLLLFPQEYFPSSEDGDGVLEPYTVEYDEEEHEYVVEGPRIDRMLGYTNLDTEKGFAFFQRFMRENGILEELEKLGIQEGDTVRRYGLSFDYYPS